MLKSALIYIVLVGGSVLCIVGLLVLGEETKAPMSVGGTWAIETARRDLPAGCNVPIAAEKPVLKVSQSGTQLVLTFNDTAETSLIGELEGSQVIAESSDGNRLRVEGTVERGTDADRLTGSLVASGCGPVPWTATRLRHQASSPKTH